MEEKSVEILGFNLKSNIEFLSNIKGFESAELNLIQSIAQLMQKQRWAAKTTIFEEGDSAEAFYIIDTGTVNIIKNGKKIAQLHGKNFFGEIGVLEAAVRGANVETESECIIYLIPGFTLKNLAQKNSDFQKFFQNTILDRK